MKILYVAPYLPNTLRIRPYKFIQHLCQNHEFTVVGLLQPAWSYKFLDELKPLCKEVHAIDINRTYSIYRSFLALFSKKPMSVAYFTSHRLKSLVYELALGSEFDIIHTEFIRAAPYTADIQGIPKLFDSVDSLSLAYERGWRNRNGSIFNRTIALEEWIKMRQYEPKMIRSFDHVIVSSPIDQEYLGSVSGPTVDIVPNGVDYDYFYWDNQERDENSIVFVGAMSYYVNVDSVNHFCRSTFPIIQKQRPKVHFSIVGSDPKVSIRNQSINPAIEVTGYIPDIRPYISRAAVFICPLLAGSGIQNKLLQAMAMGTPIVTTSIAIQALEVKDGEHLLVADDPQQFAEAVVSLMTNKTLRKRLSENARNYIQDYHDWGMSGQKLDSIYESLI